MAIHRVPLRYLFTKFWDWDQITEDTIKKLKAFQLIKIFLYTLRCHLLNVAGCVKKTSKTFKIAVTYFLDVFSSPKTQEIWNSM